LIQRLNFRKNTKTPSSYLVRGLWSQRDEVPEHVGIFEMSLWVAFLGVNERWKLETKNSSQCGVLQGNMRALLAKNLENF